MFVARRSLFKSLLRPCIRLMSDHSKAVAHHEEHDSHEEHDDHHGHHHHRPYDWRDDHSKNWDFEQDILHRGVPHPRDYEFPFKMDAPIYTKAHPKEYNPKDLRYNFVGSHKLGPLVNTLRAPETDHEGDIAHEYDYESQDLDFQPQSFKTQHFRKKGNMWMWLFVGLMPFIYVSSEFFFQHFPDEDHWRYQRPPPLDDPDPEETPDTQTHELFDTPEFRSLYEAGQLVPPFFDIVDGKKVYTKASGVNQPMEVF